MRNRYNYNELVRVNGEGKQFGKVENALGFIIEKDQFFDDYYIELIFGKKDWFHESSIERILGEKRNKSEKYQVMFCTTNEGYELIKARIKEREPISNNKFKNIDIRRKFDKDSKTYIILGWRSTFWPTSNMSVKILEKTMQDFKTMNIPFQYILMNQNILTDIKIEQFCEIDMNVDVFLIERKIKVKSLK